MRPVDADYILSLIPPEEVCSRYIVANAPTIESIPIAWIEKYIEWLEDMDGTFAKLTAMNIEVMVKKWRKIE